MFTEIPGGSSEIIQGLTCWIPPQGKIFDPITDSWIKVPVIRRSKDNADCYWEPDPRWKKLAVWEKEEIKLHEPYIKRNADLEKMGKDPEPLPAHHELNKFRKEMWQYRLGGCWFVNNGEATYITGIFWFFLSVYQGKFRTPNNLPKYRDVDRQYFNFWQYCWEDPNCYGMIETRKRQDGKSYRAGCIALEMGSRISQFHAGIQSKADDDAAAFFEKNVLNPFRKLPTLFLPKSNLEGKRSKVAELLFISGKARADESEELESKISHRSSTIKAYDGEPLGLYIGDEEGKCKHINVSDRWNIVRYCLRNEEGKKTGCSIHTSTVEASEEGGEAFDGMWKKSNQYEMGDNVRTASGLYKFFISAALTRNLDKYGLADEAKSIKEIMEEREVLDARALSQARRREPLTDKEAFSVDATKCKYDPVALALRHEELIYSSEAFVRGNFKWKDGIPDGEVIWLKNPNGKYLMAWEPPEDRRNLRKVRGKEFYPGAKFQGAGGADPYDHQILSIEGQYSMSMGALVILKKPYMMDNTAVEGGPALIYSYRPNSPEELYEDFLMAAVYYGVEILIETNKPGCDKHFKDRGYGAYSHQLPNKTKSGIVAQSNVKGGGVPGQITDVTEQYIVDHLDKVFFPQMIDQWLRWDPMDTTRWDLAVAAGYAIMLMNNSLVAEKKKGVRKALPLSDYMYFAKKRGRGIY